MVGLIEHLPQIESTQNLKIQTLHRRDLTSIMLTNTNQKDYANAALTPHASITLRDVSAALMWCCGVKMLYLPLHLSAQTFFSEEQKIL